MTKVQSFLAQLKGPKDKYEFWWRQCWSQPEKAVDISRHHRRKLREVKSDLEASAEIPY